MGLEQSIDQWEEERKYFEKDIERIERQYGRTTYVAIYKKQVIDSDKDESRLLKRVDKAHPYEPVLVTSVESFLNPEVYEEPSPETEFLEFDEKPSPEAKAPKK